ncbi:uncharacterized protein CCOS01_10636, partial [Colletotrichum costaricense]
PHQIRPSRPSQAPPADWPTTSRPRCESAVCRRFEVAQRQWERREPISTVPWAQTRSSSLLKVLGVPTVSNKVLRYGSCAPDVGLRTTRTPWPTCYRACSQVPCEKCYVCTCTGVS